MSAVWPLIGARAYGAEQAAMGSTEWPVGGAGRSARGWRRGSRRHRWSGNDPRAHGAPGERGSGSWAGRRLRSPRRGRPRIGRPRAARGGSSVGALGLVPRSSRSLGQPAPRLIGRALRGWLIVITVLKSAVTGDRPQEAAHPRNDTVTKRGR